jgi:hypothetical protein
MLPRASGSSWTASTPATSRPTTRTPTWPSACVHTACALVQPASRVIHDEGTSNGTDTGSG